MAKLRLINTTEMTMDDSNLPKPSGQVLLIKLIVLTALLYGFFLIGKEIILDFKATNIEFHIHRK
jgi:hypothetical protein